MCLCACAVGGRGPESAALQGILAGASGAPNLETAGRQTPLGWRVSLCREPFPPRSPQGSSLPSRKAPGPATVAAFLLRGCLSLPASSPPSFLLLVPHSAAPHLAFGSPAPRAPEPTPACTPGIRTGPGRDVPAARRRGCGHFARDNLWLASPPASWGGPGAVQSPIQQGGTSGLHEALKGRQDRPREIP